MDNVGDWKVEGGKMEKTTCSGIDFYGGPNKMGSGTILSSIISGIPPHYKLKIQF